MGLVLPIVLSGVAIFFASFLSWMVLQLHRSDWIKLSCEDDFLASARQWNLSPGNYMFPGCDSPKDMQSDEYKQKFEAGPTGVITVFTKMGMGPKLGLTMLYFLGVNAGLAFLASRALPPDATFGTVFVFVGSAGVMIFLGAIVQHAIWFRNRIVGHIVESIAYGAIAGVIFGALW
ncbi:MAG: hypothetical protein CMJ18_13120 [Phycisphaeraceae bacterium]|nr:hypothetical protein [Phycisphaeraceae bacterium]